jgi:hypothetical protein
MDEVVSFMKAAMVDAELTLPELWLRYFALGGTGTLSEHDVVAHALNERFTELDRDSPVAYRRAYRAEPPAGAPPRAADRRRATSARRAARTDTGANSTDFSHDGHV